MNQQQKREADALRRQVHEEIAQVDAQEALEETQPAPKVEYTKAGLRRFNYD